jgi:hypothetical protein
VDGGPSPGRGGARGTKPDRPQVRGSVERRGICRDRGFRQARRGVDEGEQTARLRQAVAYENCEGGSSGAIVTSAR